MRTSFSLFLFAAACGMQKEPPPAEPAEPVKPTCAVALDGLAGKTFVRQVRSEDGKEMVDDPIARVQFFQDGEKLKARYTVRSVADVYTYSCHAQEDHLTCWEDNPRAADWCRSLFANKGECTVDGIVALTGMSPEDAQKGHKEVTDELKKLPKKEIEDMKLVFNSPNNQLRGILHVKIRPSDCQLSITDNYQTMTYGQVREMANIVGISAFKETDRKYVFEHCKDDDNLVALEKPGTWVRPGQTKREWKKGDTVSFRFVGPERQKPQAGCTYEMDSWVQYEPVAEGAPVALGPDGRLAWGFDHTFTKAGKYVVHQYRYETCGGGDPKRIGVACQALKVN